MVNNMGTLLRTWYDIDNQVECLERESLNQLELFIYDNEPAGDGEYKWREQLEDALLCILRERCK